MADTPHLGLPLIAASQSQKHVTHNGAIVLLDAVVQLSVVDSTHAAPPATPGEGDRYKVAPGATGAWAAWDLNVALFTDGQWKKLVPRKGWLCWDEATGSLTAWSGSAWIEVALTVAAVAGGSLALLGIRTAADANNRLAVKSNAVLLSHDDVTPGTGNMHATLNKSAAAKDAGFVFQDNWSTRALFGLLGDDHFTIKVTPDGSSFFTAIVVDKDTGAVSFPRMAKFVGYLNYNHYAAAHATNYVNTDVNSEDLDTANAFAANVFTVPRAGLYRLGYTLGWTQNGSNLPTSMQGRILKNGATELLPGASRACNLVENNGKIIIHVESIVPLAAGDTLRLQHKFSTVDGYATASITRFWIEQING